MDLPGAEFDLENEVRTRVLEILRRIERRRIRLDLKRELDLGRELKLARERARF